MQCSFFTKITFIANTHIHNYIFNLSKKPTENTLDKVEAISLLHCTSLI